MSEQAQRANEGHTTFRLLPPHVNVVTSPEYELRHPTGQVDTFTDIGDASDFRDQFFPSSRMFRREVTSVEIRSPWSEVDLDEREAPDNVVPFGNGGAGLALPRRWSRRRKSPVTAELVLRALVGNPEDGPLDTQDDRVLVALRYAVTYGQIDGEHHKSWVIDQMVRALLADSYEEFVDRWSEGEDGPETYYWEKGVAP